MRGVSDDGGEVIVCEKSVGWWEQVILCEWSVGWWGGSEWYPLEASCADRMF